MSKNSIQVSKFSIFEFQPHSYLNFGSCQKLQVVIFILIIHFFCQKPFFIKKPISEQFCCSSDYIVRFAHDRKVIKRFIQLIFYWSPFCFSLCCIIHFSSSWVLQGLMTISKPGADLKKISTFFCTYYSRIRKQRFCTKNKRGPDSDQANSFFVRGVD